MLRVLHLLVLHPLLLLLMLWVVLLLLLGVLVRPRYTAREPPLGGPLLQQPYECGVVQLPCDHGCLCLGVLGLGTGSPRAWLAGEETCCCQDALSGGRGGLEGGHKHRERREGARRVPGETEGYKGGLASLRGALLLAGCVGQGSTNAGSTT